MMVMMMQYDGIISPQDKEMSNEKQVTVNPRIKPFHSFILMMMMIIIIIKMIIMMMIMIMMIMM